MSNHTIKPGLIGFLTSLQFHGMLLQYTKLLEKLNVLIEWKIKIFGYLRDETVTLIVCFCTFYFYSPAKGALQIAFCLLVCSSIVDKLHSKLFYCFD